MKKALNSFFYTGLLIVCLPPLCIVIVGYASLCGSKEKSKYKVRETPSIEKKIVYDTVRIEIKVPAKTKKKKEKSEELEKLSNFAEDSSQKKEK